MININNYHLKLFFILYFIGVLFSVSIVIASTSILIPTEIFLIVILLYFILLIIYTGEIKIPRSSLFYILLILFFYNLINVILSDNILVSLKAVARNSLYFLLLPLILFYCYVYNLNAIKKLLEILFFVGLIFAFYGIYTQIKDGFLIYQTDFFYPFFQSHNVYGSVMAFLGFYSLGFFLIYRKFRYLAFFIIFSISVLLSFSKSCILAYFITFTLFLFLIDTKIIRKSLIFLFILIISYISIINTPIEEQFHQTMILKSSKNMERINRWYTAVEIFKQNKLTGIGTDIFAYNFLSHMKVIEDTEVSKEGIGAHNLYLKFLCEKGVIGFLILGILITIFFKRSIKLYKNENCIDYKYLILSSILFFSFILIRGVVAEVWYMIKITSLFWFSFSIIMIFDHLSKKNELSSE